MPISFLDDKDFLNEVAQEYFDCDNYELEIMIRIEKPWNQARGTLAPDEPCYAIIQKKWIEEYYGARVKE